MQNHTPSCHLGYGFRLKCAGVSKGGGEKYSTAEDFCIFNINETFLFCQVGLDSEGR